MGNEQIKVLHIDTEKSWRGGQQQVVYLFEAMLEAGYNTKLLCKVNSALELYCKKANIPYCSIKMRNEFDIMTAYKIAKICKKEKFNILHLHSAHAMAIGLLVKLFYHKLKLVGVKRVDFNIKKNFLSKIKYSKMDKIVCVSNRIKHVLIEDKIEEDKLLTIHSGIDLKKFDDCKPTEELKNNFDIPESNIIVGTVAAITGHKDYPNLIKAAKLVIDKIKNITFCAVGDGKLRNEMQNYVKKIGLEKHFIFLGFRKDVGDLLKTFDIFVLASHLEGLGTSILDAQAAGLPVIATEAGGIPEIIENNVNGILVPPKNSTKLAEAIMNLSKDKKGRRLLIKKAKETIRTFDIKNTIEKNIELYRDLLKND